MKVSVASIWRSHPFDLAEYLERARSLGSLYTGYPRRAVRIVPPALVKSCSWFIAPWVGLSRVGLHGANVRMEPIAVRAFDAWMAGNLEPCDVFQCSAGHGTLAHERARELGSLTVCDQVSSHTVHLDRILAEEYDRWGVSYRRPERSMLERELHDFEKCDLILVPSNFVFRTFVENGVSCRKLRKSPYGVNLRTFRPVPKRDDVFRVIYVGAMNLRKGIGYLLEALAPLKLPKFELCLIGPVWPEVRRLMARYEGRFRYLGTVSNDRLFDFYSQGSVFVLGSVAEGLALVMAQAMACGLPVIATSNSGADDLFTDGEEGFIVPIRDPDAIREKVLYLYNRPDARNTMADSAVRKARSLGGWESYGERALSIYAAALDQCGSGAASPAVVQARDIQAAAASSCAGAE